MTDQEAWRRETAIGLIVLGVVVTLLARLPISFSLQSLSELYLWRNATVVGLLLLVLGAFAARGGMRIAVIVLIALDLLISGLTAYKLYQSFSDEL